MIAPGKNREGKAYFAELGRHVATVRKARGMTQAELGRAVGVSQQAIFAYELGERRISLLILREMSKVLATPVEDLIGMAQLKPAPHNRRLSPRAMRHAERIQGLPKTQQRFVIKIIDVLEQANSQ